MDIGQIGNGAKPAPRVDSQPVTVAATGSAARPVQSPSPVMTPAAVQQPDPAQLSQALQSINKALQSSSSNLEFTVDDDTDRTVVKVVDQQTGDIIRQMPSVEALEIAKALDRAAGKLINQEA
ncbi:MAG TPA: flagellar protein FlaG [Oxalicibacterium sp.]|uniref:flagellar protein FlaG n=1 Tax=Oxalicibacterium sp. TaxID=2766525 RepID=UPI002B5E61C0|nr:flagellar protein FlaG [Oxalicibacterium sp.]HWU98472.1 flagellar protein FlaG [Oxalicibacterium sp.]